jgi:hypothetical protein
MAFYDEVAYKATLASIKQYVNGLTDEEISWKPSTTAWSIKEIVQHLIDHHLVVSFRIRTLLSLDEPAQFVSFNQDNWVNEQHANLSTITELFAIYEHLIHFNSGLFDRLSEQQFAKQAINFKGELVTVTQIIEGLVSHVNHHLAQIERNKSQLTHLVLKEEV